MTVTILSIEITGHLVLLVTFIILLIYTIRSRKQITRYVLSSRILYWLIMLMSGLFVIIGGIRLYFLLTNGTVVGMSPLMDLLAEYPSVIAQSLIIFFLISRKIVLQRSPRSLHVLAIGAHPDDLEIAAGATLATMIDHGHHVHGLIMTHGALGGDPNIRPEEARQGGKYLGLSQVSIMNFFDTRLTEQSNEMVQVIESMIEKIKPDLILTHSLHDVHQDHIAVYNATLRAGRNQHSILCYESPSATHEYRPGFYVQVNDYVHVKIEAIHTHWDQRNKPYMKEEQLRGTLAFRGSQAKVEFAEGFEIVRFLSTTIGEI